MIRNKYFIISLPEEAIGNILSHCIGTAESQRQSLNGSKTVVKLPVGNVSTPKILNAFTEYTHSEILAIMQGEEWSENINL